MSSTDGARVSLFMGKGGVGKTTVSAAFAMDRARAGERVLLTSLVSPDEMEARLRREAGGVDLHENLDFLQLDPDALVDDVVRRITRLGMVAELVINHPGYGSMVDIVPGIRELAILNLLWNKAEGHRVEGRPYDRVILDGAATGHGVHLLEAPSKSAGMLVGDLRERALTLDAFLKDPERTEVVLVTLPEEMPVRESLQLAWGLRDKGFLVEDVVVNKWPPHVFADHATSDLLTRLEEDPDLRAALEAALDDAASGTGDAGEGVGVDVDRWVDAAGHVRAQRRENLRHLHKLAGLDCETSLVPLLPESEDRLVQVAEAMMDRVDPAEVLDTEEVDV